MQENPYHFSGTGDDSPPSLVRPWWIYAATLLTGLFCTAVPVSFCLMVFYYLRLVSGQESLVLLAVLGISLILGLKVAHRTWMRLNRVHERLSGIQQKRNDFRSEHTPKR